MDVDKEHHRAATNLQTSLTRLTIRLSNGGPNYMWVNVPMLIPQIKRTNIPVSVNNIQVPYAEHLGILLAKLMPGRIINQV